MFAWAEALEDRQRERGGLAGAGLGGGENVAAGEDERDGLVLDGVGVTYPSSATVRRRSADRPSESKVKWSPAGPTAGLGAGVGRTCGLFELSERAAGPPRSL